MFWHIFIGESSWLTNFANTSSWTVEDLGTTFWHFKENVSCRFWKYLCLSVLVLAQFHWLMLLLCGLHLWRWFYYNLLPWFVKDTGKIIGTSLHFFFSYKKPIFCRVQGFKKNVTTRQESNFKHSYFCPQCISTHISGISLIPTSGLLPNHPFL